MLNSRKRNNRLAFRRLRRKRSSDEFRSRVEGEMCLYVDRLETRRYKIMAKGGHEQR
jgi:hypothetical protein